MSQSDKPIERRIAEFLLNDGYRDKDGQCHFPPATIGSGQMDRVRLGRPGGYYPKTGGK